MDPSYCQTQYNKEYCAVYANVPYDCPNMCDVCPCKFYCYINSQQLCQNIDSTVNSVEIVGFVCHFHVSFLSIILVWADQITMNIYFHQVYVIEKLAQCLTFLKMLVQTTPVRHRQALPRSPMLEKLNHKANRPTQHRQILSHQKRYLPRKPGRRQLRQNMIRRNQLQHQMGARKVPRRRMMRYRVHPGLIRPSKMLSRSLALDQTSIDLLLQITRICQINQVPGPRPLRRMSSRTQLQLLPKSPNHGDPRETTWRSHSPFLLV